MEDRQRPTAHGPATTDHGQNPQAPRDLTTGKLAPTPRLLAPSSPPAPRILRKGGRPAANEEQKGRNAARKGHAWAEGPVPTASASVCRVARNRTSSPRTSARACPRRERNCQQGEKRVAYSQWCDQARSPAARPAQLQGAKRPQISPLASARVMARPRIDRQIALCWTPLQGSWHAR